jgi:hypothetical protein
MPVMRSGRKLKKKGAIDSSEQPASLMECIVRVADTGVETANFESEILGLLIAEQNAVDDRYRGKFIAKVEVHIGESGEFVGQTAVKKYVEVIHAERGFVPRRIAALQAYIAKYSDVDAPELKAFRRGGFRGY